MYSDRNLVNRRNVKSDVSAAANACRRFFQLEVEARIIAAALSILGMKKMDDEKPIRNMFEGTSTTDNKKSYLHHISSLVVDKFVVDQKRNTDVEQSLYGLYAGGPRSATRCIWTVSLHISRMFQNIRPSWKIAKRP